MGPNSLSCGLVFATLVVNFFFLYKTSITTITLTKEAIDSSTRSSVVDASKPTSSSVVAAASGGGGGGGRCVGLDLKEEPDSILSSTTKNNNYDINQVFVTMPAKGAGTSMITFTHKCIGNDNPRVAHLTALKATNDINRQYVMGGSGTVEAPHLISGHSTQDTTLIRMIQNSNRHTLIIYVHREETDRLASAIKHVVRKQYRDLLVCDPSDADCTKEDWTKLKQLAKSGTTGAVAEEGGRRNPIDEKKLIRLIEARTNEIGSGQTRVLTCDTYDAIVEHSPNMIFMNYQQADQLQKLLAKRFCPQLLKGGTVKKNMESTKKQQEFFVQLSSPRNTNNNNNNNTTTTKNRSSSGSSTAAAIPPPAVVIVEFDKWLEGKRHLLEWALNLKAKATCSGKTKRLEDKMLGCAQEAYQVPNYQHDWW